MLTIRQTTGSIAQVIAGMRDVPARLVPYVASTALTRTAQIAAKKDLPDAMRAAFINPTPYTLNSLFVKPSTKDTLSARVMVKDQAKKGIVPEKFLFPSVNGGGRNEKRFEKSLRYEGVLERGERAMSGYDIRDAFGNAPPSTINSILAWVKKGAKKKNKKVKVKRMKGVRNAPFKQVNPNGYILLGNPGAKVRGIAQRSGGIFRHLFIFTRTLPDYTAILDFEGIALKAANENFETEYKRAFAEMRAKGKV